MAEKRRTRFDALIAAVAAGDTVREASKRLRIAERTAYRQSATADFRKRVSDIRSEMVDRSLGKLADMIAQACDELRKLLTTENESVRLGAIRAAFELGGKLRESVELENRVAQIEARLNGKAALHVA